MLGWASLLAGLSVGLLVWWAAPFCAHFFAQQERRLGEAFEAHGRYFQAATIRRLMGVSALALGFVFSLLTGAWFLAPLVGVLAFMGLQKVLRVWGRHQQRQLIYTLPEFCDLLAASLQSGASLRASLVRAEQASHGPLRKALHLILRDIRLGHPTEEAFVRWAEQVGHAAVRDLAFCVRLSVQTGGNLAEALMRLGESIRQQIALQAKAAALTAQGRLQALIMLAMPPLLFLATSLLDPFVSYFFLQTPTGLALVGLMAALELMGAVWVRRIVRFEV